MSCSAAAKTVQRRVKTIWTRLVFTADEHVFERREVDGRQNVPLALEGRLVRVQPVHEKTDRQARREAPAETVRDDARAGGQLRPPPEVADAEGVEDVEEVIRRSAI